MDQDIIQLMSASRSVIDLEARLKEVYGKDFSNWKEYIKWLDAEWSHISADKVNQILETSPTETKFPTLIVESDGVEYHLHGITHSGSLFLALGWQLKRNVRSYISEVVASFHRPSEGEDYVYEQYMNGDFDLLQSQEFEDVERTIKKSKSRLKNFGMAALSIPIGIINLIAKPIIYSGMYLYSKTIKNPKNESQRLLYLAQKALTDERYQAHVTDFLIAREMPQPFNLEKRYLSQKGGIANTLFPPRIMEPFDATPGERSLWTAGELRDYAKERRLKKLHYLGGAAHMTEIAYFLQHPGFSFERLEEYRIRRK